MNTIINLHRIEDLERYAKLHVGSVIVSLAHHGVRGGVSFTLEQLPMIIEEAKKYDLQVYLLLNKLYVEEELEELRSTLQVLKTLAIDGIYFGDLGFAYEAKQAGLDHLLIYNPDTLVTNSQDVLFYFTCGMKMVSLSKEITVEEILEIARIVKQPLEVIIHGRLNMMHSKRKLLSNYEAFLEKDLDLTKQKELYLIEETRDDLMPVFEDEFGTHVFTGFTFNGFNQVEEFIKAGIINIRIENLFLSIEEEEAVLRTLHKIINKELDKEEGFLYLQNKYPKQNITDGFMYKETGALK